MDLHAAPETIGSLLRFHRRAAGLTQAQLARAAGVGRTVIFDIEHGKPTIQMDTLIRVLDVVNMRLLVRGPMTVAWQDSQLLASKP